MLNKLKDHLDKKQALIGPMSPVIDMLSEVITNKTVPERMKQTLAVSDAVLFASQFRRPIQHWDGTLVPINAIAIVISGSGVGKDSSKNAIRACFNPSYKLIGERRNKMAKQRAITLAKEAGDNPDPSKPATYKEYYVEPNPLFTAISTAEGWFQHLNDLATEGMGSGYIYSGEVGSELASNPLMIDNIRALSELYDVGNKEVKIVKARENQSKEIVGMPTNALFQGSPINLLYNERIKSILEVELGSKLARRAFLAFCPDDVDEEDYDDIEDMLLAEEDSENESYAIREKVSVAIEDFTEHHLPLAAIPITVSSEVRKLFLVYKRYNAELAETISPEFPMTQITRRHFQWKALKLAGAFAMYAKRDVIIEDDFIFAIRFCELLDRDLMAFEKEMVKEPYENFADYMASEAIEGKASIGLHSLRKRKYIPTSGNPDAKMKELCHLANSYSQEGVFSVVRSEILYEAVVKTDTIGISFKPINNNPIFKAVEDKDPIALKKAKESVAATTSYGLSVEETTFSELGNMLEKDFAYSPFRFKDGVRGKDNIIGGSKWLVLDVDDSVLTAQECHFILEDLNHYVALSSDPDNEFKFRVLIELDAIVDVDSVVWSKFRTFVAEDLSLNVDQVAQSQIFYSYSNRTVYSQLEGRPLEARPYLVQAQEAITANPPPSKKALSNPQKKALLDDPMTTFAPAFEASAGEGSRKLIWAANYAYKDLGADKDEVIKLLHSINDYWSQPMPEERLQTTVLNQVLRW